MTKSKPRKVKHKSGPPARLVFSHNPPTITAAISGYMDTRLNEYRSQFRPRMNRAAALRHLLGGAFKTIDTLKRKGTSSEDKLRVIASWFEV